MQETIFDIKREMFKWLISGKEVVIEQPDGTKLKFALSGLDLDEIETIVRQAKLEKHGVADC